MIRQYPRLMDRVEARLILGLPPEATAEEAEIAYRSLAKVVHPDVGGDAVTFSLLQEAWVVLKADSLPHGSSTDRRSTPYRPNASVKTTRATGLTSGEEMTRAANQYFFWARMGVVLAILLGVVVSMVIAAVTGSRG